MPRLLAGVREQDLVIFTADHGNDPTTPSTDHSRERVPVLVYGPRVRPVAAGERTTFADIGQTVAEFLGVSPLRRAAPSWRDLAVADALVEAARAVQQRAYAPYSQFPGRVRRSKRRTARVFVGCNVENASYGLTICAERAALVSAVAAGARAFRRIVVVTDSDPPASPCGACRQVLAEFGLDLRVLAVGPSARAIVDARGTVAGRLHAASARRLLIHQLRGSACCD